MNDKIKDLADTLLDSKYSFIFRKIDFNVSYDRGRLDIKMELTSFEKNNSLMDIGQSKKLIVIPERELEAFLHRMIELSLK